MLRRFDGFTGRGAVVQIGDITFMIVARTDAQLAILHTSILKQAAGPFIPEACKPVIVISPTILPETKPTQ